MKPSELPIMESPPGAEVMIDGRRYTYFSGTSYLGLAGHPEVIEAGCEALRRYGVHSATSRARFGNNPVTLAVEARASEFFGTEDAFYFASGYVGNQILLQVLDAAYDTVLLDEHAHYSLEDAVRLSGRPVRRFRHRDSNSLAEQLKEEATCPLVATDGVFPASGGLAPLREYMDVLRTHGSGLLVVDDAHGFGVLGDKGRGVVEYTGLWGAGVNVCANPAEPSVYVSGTLSKALGGFGGVIPGSDVFIEKTRAVSHYFNGASAPPSAAAGSTAQALKIVMRAPDLRARLSRHGNRLRAGLQALGLPVEDSPAAHLGLVIGDAANMQRLQAGLQARGYLVLYMDAYSGTGKEGMIRIALCALHTEQMIDGLLAVLGELL